MLERVGSYLKVNEIPQTISETAKVWSRTTSASTQLKQKGMQGALTDKPNSSMAITEPLKFIKFGCVIAPIEEELLYRLPSHLPLPKTNPLFVGISAYFAYDHCRKPDATIDYSRVPFGQFAAGIHFSNIVRERNLLHSMIAHSAWNLLCFGQVHTRKIKNELAQKVGPKISRLF